MAKSVKEKIQEIEFTTLELAELLDVTDRRIQQLAKSGILKPESRNTYSLKSNLLSYIEYQVSRERNYDDVLKDAERRKAIAEAELKEIQLETTKGKLIEIERVIQDWQKVIGVFRTRVLLVSSKVAPLLLGLRSIKRIRGIVDEELNEALNELSRTEKL